MYSEESSFKLLIGANFKIELLISTTDFRFDPEASGKTLKEKQIKVHKLCLYNQLYLRVTPDQGLDGLLILKTEGSIFSKSFCNSVVRTVTVSGPSAPSVK